MPRFLGGSVPYNPPEFCPASTGGCSKCKKYMKKIKFGITGKLLTREVLRWKIFQKKEELMFFILIYHFDFDFSRYKKSFQCF